MTSSSPCSFKRVRRGSTRTCWSRCRAGMWACLVTLTTSSTMIPTAIYELASKLRRPSSDITFAEASVDRRMAGRWISWWTGSGGVEAYAGRVVDANQGGPYGSAVLEASRPRYWSWQRIVNQRERLVETSWYKGHVFASIIFLMMIPTGSWPRTSRATDIEFAAARSTAPAGEMGGISGVGRRRACGGFEPGRARRSAVLEAESMLRRETWQPRSRIPGPTASARLGTRPRSASRRTPGRFFLDNRRRLDWPRGSSFTTSRKSQCERDARATRKEPAKSRRPLLGWMPPTSVLPSVLPAAAPCESRTKLSLFAYCCTQPAEP